MATTVPKIDQNGLKWVRTLWGLEPRWTVDLDETAIEETAKSALGICNPCSINFMAQGAFNKLYTLKFSDQEVIVRITLPIEPKWKTLSEVATMKWVRDNTRLPVPRVLAYTADRSSPIGFEWIIMEKMAGRPWADAWQEISFTAKEDLVRQLALFCADTFQKPMRGIGNLFPNSVGPEGQQDSVPLVIQVDPGVDVPTAAHIQRIVSSAFIGNDTHDDVSSGPFPSSREWLLARLKSSELTCRKRLTLAQRANLAGEFDTNNNTGGGTPAVEYTAQHDEVANRVGGMGESGDSAGDEDEEEEEDLEDLENTLTIITKLRDHLNEFFPLGEVDSPEPSCIFHHDMNQHNILVGDEGALTAVVDWESVSALPLYAACQYPPLLVSKPLLIEPIKSEYHHDENGEVVELYWEHLENYELTQLRRLFLEEMRTLQPSWVDIFESSQRQRDFDLAVTSCDDQFMIRRNLSWLSDIESGRKNILGLEERVDNASL